MVLTEGSTLVLTPPRTPQPANFTKWRRIQAAQAICVKIYLHRTMVAAFRAELEPSRRTRSQSSRRGNRFNYTDLT